MNPLPLFLLAISLPLLLGSVCNAELRTWTSTVGTKVEAELVSLTGNQVTLKTKAGKTIKLPINKLSKADQEFLTAKSSPKEPTKEAPINLIKYKITGDEVTITSCDKKASGTLTIPATIEGKTVTSIGHQAFKSCKSLTRITIPDSVTSIESEAFGVCSSLTSITIPNNVTSIGRFAFFWCDSLTNITIPDSVTNIGERALTGCPSLTNITIGDGLTSIGSGVFADCGKLNTVTFHGDAPRARSYTFLNSTPTIYRKPEAKGWGDTWGGRPVKLISEKP